MQLLAEGQKKNPFPFNENKFVVLAFYHIFKDHLMRRSLTKHKPFKIKFEVLNGRSV